MLSVNVVSLVSSLNTPAGRLLRPVLLRVSDVKLVRSSKSSAFSVVRVALLEMARVVIPARSVGVMPAQADLPATAATIASRTAAVRLQTAVAGTVTGTLLTLTLPYPPPAMVCEIVADPAATAVTVTVCVVLQLLCVKVRAPDTVAAPVALLAGVTVTVPVG